jgi:outer membrane protein OmpA-like peptidoglycan-associated protein
VMNRNHKICSGALMALSVICGIGLQMSLGVGPAAAAGISSLPGRHLQPPWWEAVQNPAPDTFVVPGEVLFGFNSTAIDAHGESVLTALLPRLRNAQSITVAGCTDAVGGAASAFNFNLGMKRAEAAVSVLEGAGVPSSQFHAVSWADTHPVADTTGLDSQTVNAMERRIVIIVTRQGR